MFVQNNVYAHCKRRDDSMKFLIFFTNLKFSFVTLVEIAQEYGNDMIFLRCFTML